jgi:hypothetical protein
MAANAASRRWSKKGLALWLGLILILLSISATTLYHKGLAAPSPFSNNILVLTPQRQFHPVILLTPCSRAT